MVAPNSRYANLGELTFEGSDGHTVVYLRRRFLPDPSSVQGPLTLVGPGEHRADLLAARTLGSVTQFYRLCDANGTSDPFDLADGAITQVYIPRVGTGGPV